MFFLFFTFQKVEWIANWITYKESYKNAPTFKKVFTITDKVKNVEIFISDLGCFKLEINEKKCDDSIMLEPAITVFGKRVLYCNYNVTSLLRLGENVITVTLSRGFYNLETENAWGWHAPYWKDKQKFLSQLQIDYVSGEKQMVCTDKSWIVAPSVWDIAFLSVPLEIYKYYGDKQPLINQYDNLKRYVSYLERNTVNDIFNSGLGDWLPPTITDDGSGDQMPKDGSEITSTFYSCKIVSDENEPFVLNSIIEDIKKRDNHLNTGILGTRYVFDVLTENGYIDLSYEIINKEDYPSFGFWNSLGYNTLLERWDKTSRSACHFMFGVFCAWFYETLVEARVITLSRKPLIVWVKSC